MASKPPCRWCFITSLCVSVAPQSPRKSLVRRRVCAATSSRLGDCLTCLNTLRAVPPALTLNQWNNMSARKNVKKKSTAIFVLFCTFCLALFQQAFVPFGKAMDDGMFSGQRGYQKHLDLTGASGRT